MSVHRDANRLGQRDDANDESGDQYHHQNQSHNYTDLHNFSHGVEIPEHLLYKAPKVVNEYANVEPRYLNARTKKDQPKIENIIPKQQIPRNPMFNGVESRILNPRRESPGRAPIPRYDAQTLELHEVIAKKEWGQASPRYLDHKKIPEGHPTPRDEVEARREANKRISSWRDVCTTPVSMTFDEYRQRNRRLLMHKGEKDHLDVKPRGSNHSPVRQYIKSSTPIEHHTMGPNYVSPPPNRGITERHWTPGGGSGGGKWKKKAGAGPSSAAVTRESDYIRSWREHAEEKRVGRQNIPRVASLSPAQSFRRWESESVISESQHQQLNYTNNSMTPNNRSNNNSPARHHPSSTGVHRAGGSSEDVVVGPVMVAVPAGTVVKMQSSNMNQ